MSRYAISTRLALELVLLLASLRSCEPQGVRVRLKRVVQVARRSHARPDSWLEPVVTPVAGSEQLYNVRDKCA